MLYSSDCHYPEWQYSQAEDNWLTEQGVDTNITYRYEVYVIDIPCLKIFQHVCDSEGLRVVNGDELVTKTSWVPIASFPPDMDK